MSDSAQLGLVALLVATNALFAGSEIALISLRPPQVERLKERGGAGRALAALATDPNRFLATIQIAITLSGFMASATAAVSLAEPVVPLLSAFGNAAEGAAVVLVTLVLTFFTLVFGELAPKRIAMQHAEGWALAVARPLDALATASRPVVWALSVSTNLVVRIAGSDPSRQRDDMTEAEIRDIIAAQPSLTSEEKQVITGALEVGERTLRQVLVPRTAIFAIDADTPVPEALTLVLASGHNRVPVYRQDPDRILGVVQLRSLVEAGTGVAGDVARPLPAFPESAEVLPTLRELQRERQQMGLVVDEHGGIAGIVTIEDLVEEIVGEIYDEHDRDVAGALHRPDGGIELPGTFPVHDLVDLGIEAPRGSYTTVAGLVMDRLGRVPDAGDQVELGEWTLEVAAVDRATVTRLTALPARTTAPSE